MQLGFQQYIPISYLSILGEVMSLKLGSIYIQPSLVGVNRQLAMCVIYQERGRELYLVIWGKPERAPHLLCSATKSSVYIYGMYTYVYRVVTAKKNRYKRSRDK